MIMKKVSRMWCVTISFGLYGMSLSSPATVHQDQGSVQLLNSSNVEEKEIIVTGTASFGNNEVTGRACVVLNRKQLSKVCRGDIVIAPAINSLWYATLNGVAGIVTDRTDDLAISLGKKLNIPVIVGANGATKKIVDAQIITCDPITKNVYHVAYPKSREVHFDIPVPQKKDDINQSLHDKLEKSSNIGSLHEKSAGTIDYCVQYSNEASFSVVQKESKIVSKAKNLYHSHFNSFKKYVLDMKSDLYKASWLPEIAFRGIAKSQGCNDFTIDCVEIGHAFFNRDPKYIVDDLLSLESDYFIQYIGKLLEECSQKPNDLNWVAYVAHKAHIESIHLPAEINKEDLISNPKHYKGVEKNLSQKDRETFIKEKAKRVGAGLFARFCVENKLFH